MGLGTGGAGRWHPQEMSLPPPGDVTATAEIPALNTGCEEPAAAARPRALGSCSPSSLHRFPRHRWREQPGEGGCSDREGFRQQKGNADRTVPPWGRQLLKALFYSCTLDLTSPFLTDATP